MKKALGFIPPKEDKHLRPSLNVYFADVTETEDAEYFGAWPIDLN